MKTFETLTDKLLHLPFPKPDAHHAFRIPVYDSAAFDYNSAEELEMAFAGIKPGHVYSRSSNPTVEYLESQVRLASGGHAVLAVSSGMAAIAEVVFALCQSGDNILASKHLFGNTYSLFEVTLRSFGIGVRFFDPTNPKDIESKASGCRMLFAESVSNPALSAPDVEMYSRVCRKYNLVMVLDTTLTPFCLSEECRGLVDIEIMSSTKFISGGGTSVGGIIIDRGNFPWQNVPKLKDYFARFGINAFMASLRKEIYRNTGSCLSAHNAYLQSLGLETMALRMRQSMNTTVQLAEGLFTRGIQVNYPGLEGSKYKTMLDKYFEGYYSTLITLDFGYKARCFTFLNNLQLIRRATNLCDNRTLAIHPYSTIYTEFSDETKSWLGVSEGLIRLSVGLETPGALLEDIMQAAKR